jgi:xylulokinase
MMPGFTAPKLLWVQRHEAAVFSQVDKVLLPKDYLRLRMTGELASDMSDAAGTLWMDVARRDWSDEMLAACDLSRDAMPALFEGSDVTGQLRPEVAQAWNMPQALVVGAAATTPPARSGLAWPMPVRRCCRWALQVCISRSAKDSSASLKARCIAFAMRCRAAGI